MSRLDLVVGSNGAGKSTFVRYTLAPRLPGSVFVNADVIAARRWPGAESAHGYEAAEIAARTRSSLIVARRPFIAETVFSHPSKVELIEDAVAAGYYVALHVIMVPEHLAIARVRARVKAGGHDVPVDKISGRYQRLWELVARAGDMVHTATLWDNAGRTGPEIVALFEHGIVVGAPAWPTWAPAALVARWPAR